MNKQLLTNIKKHIEEKQRKRKETFKIALNKCIKLIEKNTSIDIYYCFYQVPEFIIGYPLYPLELCIEYIQKYLISNGFVVKYYFPNILFVSWDEEELKKEKQIKDKKKKFIKSISSYKPSGKVVLNLN